MKCLPPNVVWLSVSASFLNDASSEMIYPLLPRFFLITLHASRRALGLMEGIAERTASLVKLASGWWGDRLPRRKPLVLVGYALAALSRPFIAAARRPAEVVLIRFADRFGKGVRGAPRDALIADFKCRHRARSAPSASTARSITSGPSPVPVSATALLFMCPHDYRLVFACAAVPALAGVAVLGLDGERAGGPPRRPVLAVAWKSAVSPTVSGSCWATISLFTLGNSSDAFLLLRAHDSGIADGLDPSPLDAAARRSRRGVRHRPAILSDRIPRRFLVIAGWVTYAAVYAGFAAAHAAWQVWALFAAYGLYAGLVEGSERAISPTCPEPPAGPPSAGIIWLSASARCRQA